MDDRSSALSFATLEARIKSMPDGPAAILNTPRPLYWLNIFGSVAIVVGLLPFLLVQFLTPQWWMVRLAQVGVWSAGVLYAPGILRALVVMAREFWHWRIKLVEQSDHDLAQFRALRSWLQTFPRAELEEHRNFARLAHDRLGSKLVLLMGGIERVGILPVLVAVFFLLREVDGLGVESLADVPLWQGVLAPFLVITWWIGVMAVRMRLTHELYAVVLTDALACGDEAPEASSI
ncbi:hypothetical protein [Luteimonas abyssi]|uniref:hypothetical protein n=1 Tax=Luteimonas abyssi TaxID=1247514 RepID=UPI000B2B5169|nr:hypothetical protein [Luteimonas abyssi]